MRLSGHCGVQPVTVLGHRPHARCTLDDRHWSGTRDSRWCQLTVSPPIGTPCCLAGIQPLQALPQHHFHNEIAETAKRGSQQIAQIPSVLDEHALGVAECAETLYSVIDAYAAGPNAAEGQVVLGVVHQRVIDGDITGGRLGQQLLAVTSSWPKV